MHLASLCSNFQVVSMVFAQATGFKVNCSPFSPVFFCHKCSFLKQQCKISRFLTIHLCLFIPIFTYRKAKEGLAARKANDVTGEKSEPSSPSAASGSPTSRKRKLGFGKVRFDRRDINSLNDLTDSSCVTSRSRASNLNQSLM